MLLSVPSDELAQIVMLCGGKSVQKVHLTSWYLKKTSPFPLSNCLVTSVWLYPCNLMKLIE